MHVGGDCAADAAIARHALRLSNAGAGTTSQGGVPEACDALDARHIFVEISDPGELVSDLKSTRSRREKWSVGSKTAPASTSRDRGLAVAGNVYGDTIVSGASPEALLVPSSACSATADGLGHDRPRGVPTESIEDLETTHMHVWRTMSLCSVGQDYAYGVQAVLGQVGIDRIQAAQENAIDSFPDAVCGAMSRSGGVVLVGRGISAGLDTGTRMASADAASDAFPGSDTVAPATRAGMAPHPWSVRGLAGELIHTSLEGFPAKAASWARSLHKAHN